MPYKARAVLIDSLIIIWCRIDNKAGLVRQCLTVIGKVPIAICDRICENVSYDQNEHSSIKHFLEPDVNIYEISLFVVFDISDLSPTWSANFKPGIPLTQKLQQLELDHLNA